MKIKEYPEFSEKYPAIDGITKGNRPPKEGREPWRPPENAIRSDIEEILEMDDIAFDSWYRSKKNSVLGLLNQFEILVTIPNLEYASEEFKYGLDEGHNHLSGLYETLKKGLEYVEVIKKVRDDQK